MSENKLYYHVSPIAKEAGVSFKPPRHADAGFDLSCLDTVLIAPGGFALIETGIHFAIPVGYVGVIKERSSVALRGSLVTAGVIDASYRGSVKVAMHNLSKENLAFEKGERIAQMIVLSHLEGKSAVEVESLDVLGETERGTGGFGSTGRT